MSAPGPTVAGPLAPFVAARAELIAGGWTEGIERRLPDLLDEAITELAGELPAGSAVVAIGGYGRQVMAALSDVDLLFLGSSGDAGILEPRVLRPLWDARLKVGHLSLTPKEARTFAGTRLDAISTFLTARLLIGEASTFEEFRQRFQRLLDKEHNQIVEMMAGEERSRRQAEPYRRMAANLKTGRGGIRTLDMVDWRRILFGAAGVEVESQRRDEAIRRDLTRLRSALHAASGRPHDEFDFDLRERAASWMGIDGASMGREILEARTRAEQLVDSVWPNLSGVADRRTSTLTSGAGLVEAALPQHRAWFHQLDAAGSIARWLPDWERLRDLPHLVPFHEYAVGDHVLATVDQAAALLQDADDPIAREVLDGLERPERLLWAALLHDVGKGLAGDHSVAGADRVRTLSLELELGADEDLIVGLVQHHLLLADLATKHDLEDPAVLTWAAERISNPTMLRFLFLLTVADSRATGTDTWSPWRAELVRRAYRRMERELARRSMPEELRVAVLADRVVAAADDAIDRTEVITHLTGFGEVYRSGHSPAEILEHVKLARQRLGVGGVSVTVEPGLPARIVVMATDRPRLLLSVAGTLAMSRLSIVDARFATRSDGRVFDTFDVVRAGGGAVDEAESTELAGRIAHVIRRGFDLSGEVAGKREAYRSVERSGIEPRIRISRLPDGGGIVEVECADRIGLLFDLARVFDAYGMPVVRARVDTRAGIAYDTFHVDRLPSPFDDLAQHLALGAA